MEDPIGLYPFLFQMHYTALPTFVITVGIIECRKKEKLSGNTTQAINSPQKEPPED